MFISKDTNVAIARLGGTLQSVLSILRRDTDDLSDRVSRSKSEIFYVSDSLPDEDADRTIETPEELVNTIESVCSDRQVYGDLIDQLKSIYRENVDVYIVHNI
jgi:hypothetical protein